MEIPTFLLCEEKNTARLWRKSPARAITPITWRKHQIASTKKQTNQKAAQTGNSNGNCRHLLWSSDLEV
jgi:hypothetical protein